MMRGGTLFSGIGAPECSSPGIDWRWAAEIDPFACAVHAARFPNVTNLGNVLEIDWHATEPVDLVIGGPPCQDYSVAGQRASLGGARGDLTLQYAYAIDAIGPAWSITENVPGWLSTPDNAFGAFLGILVGADAPLVPGRGQRWTDAGVVAGPRRTAAWRILDAQHFGVPQRRRRVFVVSVRGAGNWACAAALFPLRTSLRRDTAPRRETREDITPILEAGARTGKSTDDPRAGIGIGAPGDPMFSLQAGKQHAIANAVLTPNGGRGGVGCGAVAFQANHGGPHGRLDFESETFVACGRGGDVAATLQAAVGGNGNAGNGSEMIVAHSLRADGFDASEDGTGRGTPLIAVPIKKPHGSGGNGARRNAINGNDGDPMFALDRDSQHAVMTLAIRGRGDSHDLEYRDDGIANAVLQPGGGRGGVGVGAIAFHQNVRSEVRITDVMGALNTGGGKPGQGYPAIAFQSKASAHQSMNPQAITPGIDVGKSDGLAVQQGMSVRRLTPVECERLQGFPDGWTDVTYRGKPAADGNRYRAIGNSMAVPCLKWLIERIQSADAASRELSEAAD